MFSCCIRTNNIQFSRNICIHKYGAIKDVVRMQNNPLDDELASTQVLIQIKTVSLNAIDWKIIDGNLKVKMPITFPYILGRDFAGIIKKKGSEVPDFKKEDHVYGFVPFKINGSFTEFLIIGYHYIAHMPRIPFENACLFPLAGITALQVIKRTKINKEHKVLITGAGGSVGTTIIQMLKEVECEISVITSKPLRARSLGIKNVYFMKDNTFNFFPLHKFDIAIDCGNIALKLLPHINIGGLILCLDDDVPLDLAKKFKITTINFNVIPNQDDLNNLTKLITAKTLQIPPSKIFEFVDAMHALQLLKHRQVQEKIVLQIESIKIDQSVEEVRKESTSRSKTPSNSPSNNQIKVITDRISTSSMSKSSSLNLNTNKNLTLTVQSPKNRDLKLASKYSNMMTIDENTNSKPKNNVKNLSEVETLSNTIEKKKSAKIPPLKIKEKI